MIRRVLPRAALVAATVIALGPALASPADAAADNFVFKNTGNGMCLQPVGNSLAAGAAIVQEPCDANDPAQHWFRSFNSDTTARFTNRNSLMCLDARGGAANGTPVQQWPCNRISNEKWASAWAIPSVTQVVARVSNTTSHCLDNPQQSTFPGTAMQLYACNTTPAQVWFLG